MCMCYRSVDSLKRRVVVVIDLTLDDSDLDEEAGEPQLIVRARPDDSSRAHARLEARLNDITAAIVAGWRPCPSIEGNPPCGNLLAPNGPFHPLVVKCERCCAYVCFGCGASAAKASDFDDSFHAISCSVFSERVDLICEVDVNEAQRHAVSIIEAESAWKLQTVDIILKCNHIHDVLCNIVVAYLCPPGDWSMVSLD